MAFIDEFMETSDKSRKKIRVPGRRGETDRTIYVNGNSSGYRLGNENDKIYTLSGREVSDLSVKDFARQMLWLINRKKRFSTSFFWLLLN